MEKIINDILVSEENGVYTLSMTAKLQDDMGELAFVAFTKEEVVEKDDILVDVEASKTTMPILSPVSGKVLEVNKAAETNPKLLDSTNPADNWLAKLSDVEF
ncbi:MULTISPECIES: glycine cleavage system protein H [unclassified Gemella]|uniref:glycine cleavage system protein H n=1 Tax=unclassified Gemella TaxID=2624949 RepID=UPI0010730042|nr:MULTISPECIES: glycine cleavage system protein H [unclassified Gemella]MBF0710332.1 glycine cleavage system protein H [Gemella sp. GL1.1]MBF0747008.1 glycine cleavage system protein H [Gemella sp. 19428wG2_WT2a]NYS27676.1 glycine cleavage system protein H [Gemella sp. GL1]TFU58824.1 glycine cleavage system protein H [Gemella sp. WT2a]